MSKVVVFFLVLELLAQAKEDGGSVLRRSKLIFSTGDSWCAAVLDMLTHPYVTRNTSHKTTILAQTKPPSFLPYFWFATGHHLNKPH